MVEKIDITNENMKDDDELELLLGEIPHATSSLSHNRNHHMIDDNGYGYGYSPMNGMMYGMYHDIPSCSYKQNICNGSSFFSKDDPTPKSHMMFRSYNSILPYSCFPNKIDDNLENVATNQISFINSPRSTMFGSDMSPFYGLQQNSSSPRMQIPEYRSEHFNRNVINVRYPAFEAFEASEDRLVIEGERVNRVRNKVFGGSRGHNKKCNHSCENGRAAMGNRSSSTPVRCNTLADVKGHIYMLSKDQNGCRFVQSVFDDANQEHVEIVFNEIIGHVNELMVNPFGNYLMQKLLEVCNEEQRMCIIMEVTREPRELVHISLNTHGTRVVQKLIETLKTRKQIKMVISALEPGFLSLIKDLNGNHVIQRCLQCLSNEDNKIPSSVSMLLSQFEGNYVHLATQKFSSHVVEKCLSVLDGHARSMIIRELLSATHFEQLLQDPHANYVVQTALRVAEIRLEASEVVVLGIVAEKTSESLIHV
ncbi:putative pumilio homolog 8, chloroplastic [Tanacetum coccineum]